MSDDRSEQLLEAYRATAYRADVGGTTVELRIGEPADDLSDRTGGQSDIAWAFISAANPGSERLPQEVNLSRHQALEAELAGRGFDVFPGWGVPDGDDWKPEISLLVLGIDRDDAVAIGRRFEQVAIVCGRIGGVAELVECLEEAG